MDSPNLIFNYFKNLTKIQKEQFISLGAIYSYWNAKVNLISRKDIDHLYERHVLHSLGIACVISFEKKIKILDLGSGGGFPGIPLAIMFPNASFHLIDNIGKKINIVRAIIEQLDLKNATCEQIRAQDIEGKYDFVVCRAVSKIKIIHSWIAPSILEGPGENMKNGILYLKGGDLENEVEEIGKKLQIYNLSDFFSEPFFQTKKVIHLPI